MGISVSREVNEVDRLLKNAKQLGKSKLSVGIFSDAGGDILLRANVHEYGAPSIGVPERSFIRAGLEKNEKNIISQADKLAEQVIMNNVDSRGAMELLGTTTVGMIQEYTTSLSSPPLKPETIENKGSSNPLIDTGNMRDSITYKIE